MHLPAQWARSFRNASFRRQLAIVSAVGVFCVSVLSALATSWQGSRQLHEGKVQEGASIARNLAIQSRLALLSGAAENVAEAVSAASAFPDVLRVEIRQADHRLLLEQGPDRIGNGAPALPTHVPQEAWLETETSGAWRFVSPVWALADPQSPFEMHAERDELLGYVRIDYSKATLDRLVSEVFATNFAAGLLFASLFVLVLRLLAHRLTRPLSQLSETMARAENGETGLRADLSGPRDLAEMAHAFNSMMEALEQRERELREARDSALRFARLKADFAATVSHEVRTPLNGVIGTLDMLKAGRLGAEQRELLDLAWDSSQYLLDLINNILDFSRLEAGRLEIERRDFELRPLLDGVLSIFRPQAASKRLELSLTIAPEVPAILRGDAARLRQVLINLLGNALKFTERGSVSLSLALTEGGQHLLFSVEDSGIGIAPPHLSSIFESFTQADPSTTRRYGGSGLGLSICRQVVNLMGGEIGVVSTPGTGSRFWFTVPCVRGASRSTAQPATARRRAAEHRILIAEDNLTNQRVAAGMLHLLGHESTIAANGVEALRAWRSGDWDLILMDCSMPEMDGFEATAMIRAQESDDGAHVPIVAMTANTQPADIERCRLAGMDDHLAKPLTVDALAAVLERWLGVRTTARVPSPEEPPRRPAQPLDRGTFERLREILGAELGSAVRPFLEDMPRYLAELDIAADAGDSGPLRRLAHVIKGAAGNLGASGVAAAARDLELSAERGAVEDAGAMVARIRSEFVRAEPALRAELDEAEPAAELMIDEDAPLVLVVDDDRSTRSALRHALHRSNFRVAEACDGREALQWLEHGGADAILMDALMPEMDGFEACSLIKRRPEWEEIPILMITALEDRHSIERAFDAGASDFIPKPIHLSVVKKRVRRVIDATRAERHVRHLAYSDTLTNLPNRLMFVDHLAQAIERASDRNLEFAVLFLDLDRFKFVNDTLGHEAGDRLLATMAERLRGCVRADDCVARLGGDEFTVLLQHLPRTAIAASIAQNICRTLSAPLDIDGQEIVVSASIGISVFPHDGLDVSTLLRHADTAMYRAKQTGNCFCYYEATMESEISDRLKLENALRRALERDEITVFYQPVVNAARGKVAGVEALMRWMHPERGIVQPAEFIPVAEETGLILALGEQVLRSACFQAKTWIDRGLPDFHIAVNLSAKQLEQPDLPEVVAGVLDASGLPASALILEVTESVLMQRAREPIGSLDRLRQLGVSVAIDDFGTGYSSLAYLKHLPADVLKIDRSFIQDITDGADAEAIVSGIIALAHSLRMQVVAEGVEQAAQRVLLERLGCDYLQGYLYSKPMPAEVIETRLFSTGESWLAGTRRR
ncbi:MAG: EAL domain-containing protein [Rhodocyclaceae bacterium]|nr:EAL domain-containing protein [Rhodocyclaceae bacterium]